MQTASAICSWNGAHWTNWSSWEEQPSHSIETRKTKPLKMVTSKRLSHRKWSPPKAEKQTTPKKTPHRAKKIAPRRTSFFAGKFLARLMFDLQGLSVIILVDIACRSNFEPWKHRGIWKHKDRQWHRNPRSPVHLLRTRTQLAAKTLVVRISATSNARGLDLKLVAGRAAKGIWICCDLTVQLHQIHKSAQRTRHMSTKPRLPYHQHAREGRWRM